MVEAVAEGAITVQRPQYTWCGAGRNDQQLLSQRRNVRQAQTAGLPAPPQGMLTGNNWETGQHLAQGQGVLPGEPEVSVSNTSEPTPENPECAVLKGRLH